MKPLKFKDLFDLLDFRKSGFAELLDTTQMAFSRQLNDSTFSAAEQLRCREVLLQIAEACEKAAQINPEFLKQVPVNPGVIATIIELDGGTPDLEKDTPVTEPSEPSLTKEQKTAGQSQHNLIVSAKA